MKSSINPKIVGTVKAGVPLGRPASADARRQEFERNVKLLDRSNSWFRWSGVLMLLLLSGCVALLSLSTLTRVEPLPEPEVRLAVQGSLGVMLVLMVFSLW